MVVFEIGMCFDKKRKSLYRADIFFLLSLRFMLARCVCKANFGFAVCFEALVAMLMQCTLESLSVLQIFCTCACNAARKRWLCVMMCNFNETKASGCKTLAEKRRGGVPSPGAPPTSPRTVTDNPLKLA